MKSFFMLFVLFSASVGFSKTDCGRVVSVGYDVFGDTVISVSESLGTLIKLSESQMKASQKLFIEQMAIRAVGEQNLLLCKGYSEKGEYYFLESNPARLKLLDGPLTLPQLSK